MMRGTHNPDYDAALQPPEPQREYRYSGTTHTCAVCSGIALDRCPVCQDWYCRCHMRFGLDVRCVECEGRALAEDAQDGGKEMARP